tara:strand:- start:1163 stop:2056 length:894 start_codon:yes stop_codon:yes gene_type:complete
MTTIFNEKNRRIMKSVKQMKNKTLLSHAYNASLYLSFREDFFIFGYILQALEELEYDNIDRKNIDNIMAAIHLILLSGYHTYNLPMYYNRDRDIKTNKDTLHRYCNESIAELIIIILSRNSVKRILECDGIEKRSLLKLIRLFTEYNNIHSNVNDNIYKEVKDFISSEKSEQSRKQLFDNMIKTDMYKIFRLLFIGFEVIKNKIYPSNNDLIEIDELSKRFSEIYIYTYTDLHPLCDTIQSCTDQENKFVESKSGCMELLLKRDYYNRSFQNILQFIERQFLCKIRDNMRKNTNRML